MRALEGQALLKRVVMAINPTLLTAFVAQAVQYTAALLIIPFLTSRLSAIEVGIWYVFVAIQGLAFIADFGFQPTFTRAFASAHAGATRLVSRGLADTRVDGGGPNLAMVAAILSAARLFYAVLAAVVLVLLLAGGLPYITALVRRGGGDPATAQLAWGIFAAGIVLNLGFQWISPVLMGGGRVIDNYRFIIVNRLGFAIAGIVSLVVGGGLVWLAVCQIASQTLAIAMIVPALRAATGTRGLSQPSRAAVGDVLRTIWPNAGRMGAVAIGAFLITRFSLFAVSSFAGLAAVGAYAISLQLLTAVAGVAHMPMQVTMPQIIAARVAGDRPALRRMFLLSMALFAVLFFTGGAAVVLIASPLLTLVGSKLALLPPATLALLALVLMLEGFHSNAAFFISTANEVPFVRPAVLSGIAVATSMTIAGWLGGGVTAMILCQALVQLAYNNWRWPLLAWRDVRSGD